MSRSHRTTFIASLLCFAMLAAACGGDETDAAAAADDTTTSTVAEAQTTVTEVPLAAPARPALNYAEFRGLPTACGGDQPPERIEMQFAAPDDLGIDPASTPTALISTSCGDIVVELNPDLAPATVNSFGFLAESGYFDGTLSHRIVPGFVLQAGDPTATGIGSPGYVVPDEFPPAGFAYERGVLAMANAGPGTTGSQFFIVMGEAQLPPQFNVFGRVVEGLDVLDAIAALPLGVGPSGEQSSPLEAMYLNSVTIER